MPNPPCGPCQYDGGYRLKPDGTLYPPTESVPPFTGRQKFTGPAGEPKGDPWHYEPMCAVHAMEITEQEWKHRNAQRKAATGHGAGQSSAA